MKIIIHEATKHFHPTSHLSLPSDLTLTEYITKHACYYQALPIADTIKHIK